MGHHPRSSEKGNDLGRTGSWQSPPDHSKDSPCQEQTNAKPAPCGWLPPLLFGKQDKSISALEEACGALQNRSCSYTRLLLLRLFYIRGQMGCFSVAFVLWGLKASVKYASSEFFPGLQSRHGEQNTFPESTVKALFSQHGLHRTFGGQEWWPNSPASSRPQKETTSGRQLPGS